MYSPIYSFDNLGLYRKLDYWYDAQYMGYNMNKEEELRQLFKNLSDCYADTWHSERGFMEEGEVIQAMTEDRFIEVLKEAKLLPIPTVVGQSEQLPPNPITDKEYKKLMKVLYPKDNSKRFRR
jgi:hypothetical protein